MTAEQQDRHIAWVDVETTGLNPSECVLAEVGIIVTDLNLWEIASTNVVMKVPASYWEIAYDEVLTMHARSGLLAATMQSDATPPERARDLLCEFMSAHCGDSRPPMGGSSVHFDRRFLTHRLSALAEKFGHRQIDVSSIKELCKRWRPELVLDAGEPAHRALPDLEATLAELRHYRQALWATQSPAYSGPVPTVDGLVGIAPDYGQPDDRETIRELRSAIRELVHDCETQWSAIGPPRSRWIGAERWDELVALGQEPEE